MVTTIPVQASPPRPGLVAGLRSVLWGAAFLVRTPRAWPYSWVPALILIALSLALGWAAVSGARAVSEAWLGDATSWYGRAAAEALAWTGALLGAVLGLLLALVLTPPLAGPALERIVAQAEADLGAPSRTALSIASEMWCALRAWAAAATFAVPLLALLWVVEILFAPAVFVTVPLKLLVSALCLAWNLFDYPLTLRGVRMRDRLQLVMAHKSAALGFGLAFALLFWIPCFGVLLLPVGVAAGTRLVWQMFEADSSLVPGVARGASSDLGQFPSDVGAGNSVRS